MQSGIRIVCITFSGLLALQALADTVRLHNGSVIQGKVLDVKDDKLQIDSGYGKLNIPLKEVVGLESEESFWVRFKGQKDFTQWLVNVEGDQLKLVSPDQEEEILADPKDFARLSHMPPDSDQWRWSGNANVYLNYQRGNTFKDTVNADGRLGARDRRNRHTLDWKSEQEEDDKSRLKDRWLVKYDYNRFLNPDWYLSGVGGWEKDRIKDLDHRTTLGVGVGRQFYEEPELNLRAELGVSQIWEQYDTATGKKETQAGHWAFHYDQLFWENITIFHDQDVYRRFRDSSWLLQTATGMRMKLTDLLHLTVRYEFDYDSDPQPGKKEDDSTLLFGLGASW